MSRRLVTLTSDFGRRDPWVAELKGELHGHWFGLAELPTPTVVDLGHDIEAGDIRAASWFLGRVWRSFPAVERPLYWHGT